MCVILVCPEGVRPSIETLIRCEERNPHGAGVAYRKNGAVEWVKTNDLDEIHALAQKAKGQIVIHFRIASVGAVCPELRHPFPVTPRAQVDASRGRCNAVLFQNGTWAGWKEALASAGQKAPEGPMSDARAAAILTAMRGPQFLAGLAPSRWVYFSARETARFGQWFKRGGIYFSNLYWQPRAIETPAKAKNAASAKLEPSAKAQAGRPEREPLELWDMSGVASYWQMLKPKRSR